MSGPIFCFGLIADIQHADKDTLSFEGRPQRYRESRGKLQDALADIKSRTAQLSCVLTLGDIIDGYSGESSRTSNALQLVAQMFDSMLPDTPVHHVLGNHCLTASREELLQALHMPGSYYSASLGPGWRLVVLDTTEMSLHSGYPQDSPAMQEAQDWISSHPVQQHPNAQPWNGGCSSQQLSWLQQQLSNAASSQECVIVACHHPIAPGSAPQQYLAWDYEKVLEVLLQHRQAVKCVLSGHYHPGGYAEQHGVHFVVCEGVLEAPADSNAYGVVEVWQDRIVVNGKGIASSRQLQL